MDWILNHIPVSSDILLFIIIIETLFIVILVLALFYRREDNKDDKRDTTDIQYELKKKDEKIEYWRNQFSIVRIRYEELKSEMERKQIGTFSHPQYSKMHEDTEPTKKKEKENSSYNAYADYIEKEKGKGIYLKESTNDDGTIKSEIEFDNTNDSVLPISMPSKYDYLEAANGGQFRKLLSSDEKCFFKTWEENGTRKFDFHGNVDKALANINAIFDDVCDIEGKQNGSTQIINLEPGILNNQLKVEKRAKIKLI